MLALTIKNLHKTYKNGVHALKGIDLSIPQGDFFALLGPNGAGKSTTIGIICSLINKTSGEITVFDKNIDTHWAEAKSYIGIVPQEMNFNIFEQIEQILLNQAGYYGIPRHIAKKNAEWCLKTMDLWEKRYHTPSNLSGGMKRRLMIARAIIHKPKLLILDEPTAGVDIEIRRSLWAFLKQLNEQGTTIILTTHYLEEAEHLCRHVAIIDRGHIVEQSPMKILLGKLNTESFILDLTNKPQDLPSIENMTLTLIDDLTLEVMIPKTASLNHLFTVLSSANIIVKSMRNKTNRLEELFLQLTKHTSYSE